MNAIRTENLNVYCLVDRDSFIVTVLVDNQTIATFEYPIVELARDVVASLCNDTGKIAGEDADDAYDAVQALEAAADLINDHIEDED